MPIMEVTEISSLNGETTSFAADELRISFKDKDGKTYELHLHVERSEILRGDNLEIDFIYPDGSGMMTLESIWITEDDHCFRCGLSLADDNDTTHECPAGFQEAS